MWWAVQGSEGNAVGVTEAAMHDAQAALGKQGIWSEISSAIALAAVHQAPELGIGQRGPLVVVTTSSGFKDIHVGQNEIPLIDGSWEELEALLKQ